MSVLSRVDLINRVRLSVLDGKITHTEKNKALVELVRQHNCDVAQIQCRIRRRFYHIVLVKYTDGDKDHFHWYHFNSGAKLKLAELKLFVEENYEILYKEVRTPTTITRSSGLSELICDEL